MVFSRIFRKATAPARSSTTGPSPDSPNPRNTDDPLTLDQAIAVGVQHHQNGKWTEAEHVYRQILGVEADHFDALQLLGLLLHQNGESERGAELVARAVSITSANPAVCNNLGEIYRSLGRSGDARKTFELALSHSPDFAPAHYNLGLLLQAEGNAADAIPCYEKALAVAPDSADTWFHLGNALQQESRLQDACACYRKSVGLHAAFPAALNNLGSVLRDLGHLDEAIVSFQGLIALEPTLVLAHSNLGATYADQGDRDNARACFETAVSLDPTSADAHCNLGNALRNEGKLDDAIVQLEHALALAPDSASAHYNLGMIFSEQGRFATAHESFERAISAQPQFAQARLCSVMSLLSSVSATQEQVTRDRAAFASALTALDAWFGPEQSLDGFKAVGVLQPFLLAYQETQNRELLAQHGQMCARLMNHWQNQLALAQPPTIQHERVRVGIVSAHIRDHSVWNAIVKGWFKHLDQTRFDLRVFSLSSFSDAETDFARSRSTHFEEGRRSLREWVDAIRGHQPEILIYPEIGMDPMTLMLASLRLAPVQAATWGHPETTGLPTIDFYLSAERLEPSDAPQNYAEKLVALPNLGCSYQRLAMPDAVSGPSHPQIASDVPLLLCAGTPFKYAPQYDQVLTRIAERSGQCQMIFFESRWTWPTQQLRDRLQRAFNDAGLPFEKYVVFLPTLPRPEFFGLMQRADLFLDTIGFSGFNTAMQAVECLLPIVTREGRFMRGRFASGILKEMGLSELVTPTDDAYVDLAVRVIQDTDYRKDIKRRMEQTRAVLFDDVAPIRALEDFLLHASGRG
jgi:protein O-GlcNAc transferase